MSVEQHLRIGTLDSECWADIGVPEHPNGDELTLVSVQLNGPGLRAQVGAELYYGDRGFHIDEQEGQDLRDVRLADWLRALGMSRPWSGSVGWRSLADDLRFLASCDALGHVALTIEGRSTPVWSPKWTSTITVTYALGDLIGLADSVAAWFGDAAMPS